MHEGKPSKFLNRPIGSGLFRLHKQLEIHGDNVDTRKQWFDPDNNTEKLGTVPPGSVKIILQARCLNITLRVLERGPQRDRHLPKVTELINCRAQTAVQGPGRALGPHTPPPRPVPWNLGVNALCCVSGLGELLGLFLCKPAQNSQGIFVLFLLPTLKILSLLTVEDVPT